MKPAEAVKLRDKLAVAVSASQDWSAQYKKTPEQFKALLAAEAKLNRLITMYLKELATERIAGYVNWPRYEKIMSEQQAATKQPNVDVIVDFNPDAVNTEVGIITKVVFEVISKAAAAGAVAQISLSKIPVSDLSTMVDKIARERAGDLSTQMTKTTVEKVRSSISTSLQLGEDRAAATERLMEFIDDPAKAETVAKTESANAWRRGVMETGRQGGATTKTWHVEGNPCEICAPLDGVTVGIDEDFPGGFSGEDGAHPNCKCDTSTGDYNSEE